MFAAFCFEQRLGELLDRYLLRGPIDGRELSSEPIERKLEQISLVEAAARTLASRLEVANHLGERPRSPRVDLRQVGPASST